jgi:hypothetical protein
VAAVVVEVPVHQQMMVLVVAVQVEDQETLLMQ